MIFYLNRARGYAAGEDLYAAWLKIRKQYVQQYYSDLKPVPEVGLDGTLDGALRPEIIRSIKESASPGVDLCYTYQTNADLLVDGGLNLLAMVEERIRKRLSLPLPEYAGLDVPRLDPLKLIEDGLMDPVRLFCKNEATSNSKPTRIINSVSVVDSCIERATTLWRAEAMTNDWMSGQSAVGIQLKDVSALAEFRRKGETWFRRPGEPLQVENSDVQGYEYSFKRECHAIAFEIEFHMQYGVFPDEVRSVADFPPIGKLLYVEYVLSLQDRVCVCSDGVVLNVEDCWLQSGRFKTSFFGTHVRSALCSLVASSCANDVVLVNAKSNGDDCLNTFISNDFAAQYQRFGFKITDNKVSVDDDPWSFCSHLIFREEHYPESFAKTLVMLLRNSKVTPELYDAFAFVNRARPDWPQIDALVKAIVANTDDGAQSSGSE